MLRKGSGKAPVSSKDCFKEKARALSEVSKIEGVFEGLLVIYFRCQR